MQTASSRREAESHKYNGVQFLRICAAILVLVLHSGLYVRERLNPTAVLWANGMYGVDLFFVISGFVMISSSVKLFGTAGGWKTFVRHRVVRIVPMYWLVTSLKLIAVLTTSGLVLHSRFNPAHVVASYLFLPWRNAEGQLEPLVGVGWTLNFEMFFYAVFAAALYLRRNVFLVVGVPLLLLSAMSAFVQPGWPPFSFYFSTRVLEFYLGMIVAHLLRRQKRLPPLVAATVFCGSAILVLASIHYPHLPAVLMPGVPMAMIVYSVASVEDRLHKMPSFILYLADASYVIYLIHPMCAPAAATVLARVGIGNVALGVLGGVCVGIVSGCLFHQFVEIPVTRRVRNWISPKAESCVNLAAGR